MSKTQYTFAVVTMSDKGSRGEREDTSGAYLRKTLTDHGFIERDYKVIPDKVESIVDVLRGLADTKGVSLILTTGGTGLTPSDVTPEATAEVIHREIPGMAEAMRHASIQKTPRGMLSRGKVGVRGETLIVNLPGSLKAVKENLEVVLPVFSHAIEKIRGDEGDCGS